MTIVPTFTQMLGYHLGGFALPEKHDHTCRECGGSIEAGCEVTKVYSDSWLDEGMILHNTSPYTCPACAYLTKGSTTLIVMSPGPSEVLLVTPNSCRPDAENLRKQYEGKNLKKAECFTNPMPLMEFLSLEEIETPWGAVLGAGWGDLRKHFMRNVPMNYTSGELCQIYTVPKRQVYVVDRARLKSAIEEYQKYFLQQCAERKLTSKGARQGFYKSFLFSEKLHPIDCSMEQRWLIENYLRRWIEGLE